MADQPNPIDVDAMTVFPNLADINATHDEIQELRKKEEERNAKERLAEKTKNKISEAVRTMMEVEPNYIAFVFFAKIHAKGVPSEHTPEKFTQWAAKHLDSDYDIKVHSTAKEPDMQVPKHSPSTKDSSGIPVASKNNPSKLPAGTRYSDANDPRLWLDTEAWVGYPDVAVKVGKGISSLFDLHGLHFANNKGAVLTVCRSIIALGSSPTTNTTNLYDIIVQTIIEIATIPKMVSHKKTFPLVSSNSFYYTLPDSIRQQINRKNGEAQKRLREDD